MLPPVHKKAKVPDVVIGVPLKDKPSPSILAATDVTVPVVLELPAPIKLLTSAADIPVFNDGVVPLDRIAGTPCNDPAVIYPAPFVIALLFNEILAEPLNDTPAIVLAVCNTVAEPALPVIVVCTMLGALFVIVTLPDVPPPEIPVPATTAVISP